MRFTTVTIFGSLASRSTVCEIQLCCLRAAPASSKPIFQLSKFATRCFTIKVAILVSPLSSFGLSEIDQTRNVSGALHCALETLVVEPTFGALDVFTIELNQNRIRVFGISVHRA